MTEEEEALPDTASPLMTHMVSVTISKVKEQDNYHFATSMHVHLRDVRMYEMLVKL